MNNIATFFINAGKNISFLQSRFLLLITWPVAALILGGLGWAALLAYSNEQLHQAENTALTQAGALARSYADHVSRTVEAIDQLALYIRYGWQLSDNRFELGSNSGTGLFPLSSALNVTIIDRNGNVLSSTIKNIKGFPLGDKPFFLMPKNAEQDSLYIGVPVPSPVSGKIIIPFSRKLVDRDDSFTGVVLVTVAPDYFTSNYDAITLGKHGFLAVVAENGFTEASRSGYVIHSPQDPILIANPYFSSDSGSALVMNDSFLDKRSRYVGWDNTDGYPMIALTGLDQQETLAPYWSTRSTLIHTAIWASVALSIFTLIAMGLSIGLARRNFQLEMTRATYRVATEAGNEGFYIVRPVSGTDNDIDDFVVIDSNHRGAEFLRQRREEIIGKKLSELYEGASPDRLIGMLQQANEMSSYESDVEVPSESPVVPRWVHITILRSGGDLAVTLRDISATKAHVNELERRSNEDILTGLPNRHWVQTYLSKAVRHAAEHNALLGVLFLDLDGFKAVNDSAGHAAGDELLRCVAFRLRDVVRPHDHVARLGGDEFIVILEQLAHQSDAAHVAERIRTAFKESFRLSQGVHSVGTSIGISMFPLHGTDAETLMRNADIAMYSVKSGEKGNYHFYDQRYYEALRIRMEKESQLRQAIENDQFIIYYQPRIDVSTGVTISMEALVRWAHPTMRVLEPLEFIPLAEATGLILELGRIVIDKVCKQLALWAKSGEDLVPVSINVSPRQFNEGDVVNVLSAAMAQHNIDPRLIEIELTESLMIGDSPDVASALTAIRRMGIKLLVDDFGTGYSSLSQLQQLDFDVLKVDRAFTIRIETDRGKVFFQAIITMAHALGMRVVAEGVDNLEQIKILKSIHCDEIQGFYISKPVPPSATQPIMPKWYFPSTA